MVFIAVFWFILWVMMCSLRHDNQRNCHRYRPTRSLQCLTQSSLLLQSIVNPDSPELAATKQANLSDLIRHFPDDITAGLRLAVRVAQAEEPGFCILKLNTMDLMALLPVARYLQLFIPVLTYQSDSYTTCLVESVTLQALAHRFLANISRDRHSFEDFLQDLQPLLDDGFRPELLYECFHILCTRAKVVFQSCQWDFFEKSSGLSWQLHEITSPAWELFVLFYLPRVHEVELNLELSSAEFERLNKLYSGYHQPVCVRNFQYYLSTFQSADFGRIPRSTLKMFLAIPLVLTLIESIPNKADIFNICRFTNLAKLFSSPYGAKVYDDLITVFLDSYVQELKSTIALNDRQNYRERIRFLGHVLRQPQCSLFLGFFTQMGDFIEWNLFCLPDPDTGTTMQSESFETGDVMMTLTKCCKAFKNDPMMINFYVHMAPMDPHLDLPEHSSLLRKPGFSIGWIASDSKYQKYLY